MEDLTGPRGEERAEGNGKEAWRTRGFCGSAAPLSDHFDGLSPSEAPRIEVRAWLDKLGA